MKQFLVCLVAAFLFAGCAAHKKSPVIQKQAAMSEDADSGVKISAPLGVPLPIFPAGHARPNPAKWNPRER